MVASPTASSAHVRRVRGRKKARSAVRSRATHSPFAARRVACPPERAVSFVRAAFAFQVRLAAAAPPLKKSRVVRPSVSAPSRAVRPPVFAASLAVRLTRVFPGVSPPAAPGTGLPAYLGIRIVEMAPGRLVAAMDVRAELLTPFGALHGGVMAGLVDHALGCVLYPLMERGQWAATTEFKLNYLAPVRAGTVV